MDIAQTTYPIFSGFLVTVVMMSLLARAQSPAMPEPPTHDSLAQIAGYGMLGSSAYRELEDLSDNIGGRVTGSPQALRALDWGLQRMKEIGLEDVHSESWQLSRGWRRISAKAELITPIQRPLTIDSLGWVGSTPAGGADADVVAVNINDLNHEIQANSASWRNKVLLAVDRGERVDEERLKFGAFLRKAFEAHAVAVIGKSDGKLAQGMRLTHTGGLGFNAYYEIPVVSMTAEDQLQLERFLARSTPTTIHIEVRNETTSEPLSSGNIIGEIRGTRDPGQIIVVGAHLDSWDLAQGATDNGVGVAAVLGAAEAIIKSELRPQRTIRFVLFTGEEQGLLGSFAYVKSHQPELRNHLAAIVMDEGQGPIVSLEVGGHTDLIPTIQQLAGILRNFGELRVDDRTNFETDTGPFTLAGLPAINMGQDSPEYKYTLHSAADTVDKVDPAVLARDSTIVALTAYWIANRSQRLSDQWRSDRTAQMLVKRKDDVILKAFGIWPF